MRVFIPGAKQWMLEDLCLGRDEFFAETDETDGMCAGWIDVPDEGDLPKLVEAIRDMNQRLLRPISKIVIELIPEDPFYTVEVPDEIE